MPEYPRSSRHGRHPLCRDAHMRPSHVSNEAPGKPDHWTLVSVEYDVENTPIRAGSPRGLLVFDAAGRSRSRQHYGDRGPDLPGTECAR